MTSDKQTTRHKYRIKTWRGCSGTLYFVVQRRWFLFWIDECTMTEFKDEIQATKFAKLHAEGKAGERIIDLGWLP